MLVQQLSISHKCLASIGNSLNLKDMMSEVVSTFVKETYSTYGVFYFFEDEKFEKISSTGRVKKFDLNDYKELPNEYDVVKHKQDNQAKVLILPLKKGVLYFVYEHRSENVKFDFIAPMFFNLKTKIDMSIDSCINVDLLEQRNLALKEKTLKLENLTATLQEKIEVAVKENKEKDKLLHEQAKIAQMGELIGNIAHHWRQPLNIITTTASGMKLYQEEGELTPEDVYEFTDSIVKYSKYLSKTIDDFREYVKDSDKFKNVVLQEKIRETVSLISDVFKKDDIIIEEEKIEKDDIFVNIILGNFAEVIRVVFDNCKDAFVSKNIERKWIKYSIGKKDKTAVIEIEDNAGGIPKEFLDKIFTPYFTTKHKSQGTGIGLYMSYEIIVNQLNGKFYVKNTQNGAKFFIEIPIRN